VNLSAALQPSGATEAKPVKELEEGNTRLKRSLADAELDQAML
jgi:hypothetical protein